MNYWDASSPKKWRLKASLEGKLKEILKSQSMYTYTWNIYAEWSSSDPKSWIPAVSDVQPW